MRLQAKNSMPMSNRLALSLALSLIYSIGVLAQSFVLSGRVVDDKRHQPLPYAIVSIEGRGKVCATDAKGSFSMKLTPGRYTLEIALLGYKTEVQKVQLDKDTNITFNVSST